MPTLEQGDHFGKISGVGFLLVLGPVEEVVALHSQSGPRKQRETLYRCYGYSRETASQRKKGRSYDSCQGCTDSARPDAGCAHREGEIRL